MWHLINGLLRQESTNYTEDISTEWASLPRSGGSRRAAGRGRRRENVSLAHQPSERSSVNVSLSFKKSPPASKAVIDPYGSFWMLLVGPAAVRKQAADRNLEAN